MIKIVMAVGRLTTISGFTAGNRKNAKVEGIYYIISEEEPEPVLVHGYYCTDMGGAFVFGFNTYDGGALLPLSDMKKNTEVWPVTIRKGEVRVL